MGMAFVEKYTLCDILLHNVIYYVKAHFLKKERMIDYSAGEWSQKKGIIAGGVDRRLSSNKSILITTTMNQQTFAQKVCKSIHSRFMVKNFFLEIDGPDYRQLKRTLF